MGPEVDEFEIIEMKELLKDLREKFDLVTIRTVAKLHDQFGHPISAGVDGGSQGHERRPRLGLVREALRM